ncbi:DUF3891 family protein [Evansella tamaricis]|uniref:DUF3891 family protein n=1 Tax=Evansella tamaricis TaxID=2069301 RepID=A0ABS6JMC1_9BACI|nr:DUF3891 family protein [Evansella tamaricis]MBU9714823.1 DUF3891 family protein [Evansella tamaricis]
MIVKETDDGYILIKQDDHAFISGVFVKNWRDDIFMGADQRSVVHYAIEQHDTCWQELDDHPILLEDKGKPASFVEYPLQDKITAYRTGVDKICKENKYAALLISMHYASFFKGNVVPEGVIYRDHEKKRQEKLIQELKPDQNTVLTFHFDLLQLCDNLSLYICMNKWGASKREELDWFRGGFPQQLLPMKGKRFSASWLNEKEVTLDPYPFLTRSITVTIPYRFIAKAELKRKSFRNTYKAKEEHYHSITFRP